MEGNVDLHTQEVDKNEKSFFATVTTGKCSSEQQQRNDETVSYLSLSRILYCLRRDAKSLKKVLTSKINSFFHKTETTTSTTTTSS